MNTEIIIKANDKPIGAIQKISYNENGENLDGYCNRIRFDNINEAFMRGFVCAASQRIPFDIVILDIFTADVITTVIKNVWIRNIGAIYTLADLTVAENVSFVAEHIESKV